MTLYTETGGSGPDLILIHGWGLHGGIWDGLAPVLEANFRVTRVDLPGHGRSPAQEHPSLERMVEAVLDSAPREAAWLGWSLGSLVAAQAAIQAPARITGLVLLAGTPCFVQRPGWQAAMAPALLDTFAAELQADYARTLTRFLALQVRGSDNAGEVLRALRAGLLAHGEPDPTVLQAGLDILRTTDLRADFPRITCPALLLMGERDRLVPAMAGHAAAQLLPDARVEVIPGSGHAPFIAQPEQVAAAIGNFLLPGEASASGGRHG